MGFFPWKDASDTASETVRQSDSQTVAAVMEPSDGPTTASDSSANFWRQTSASDRKKPGGTEE